MNADTKTKSSIWLFNPFVYIAGAKALVIGWIMILVAGFVGTLSHTHFDGAIDIHAGGQAPVWLMISEGFIDWLCLSAMLLIAGRIVSRTPFRTIDLAGTQALARWPTIFAGLIALSKGSERFGNYLLELLKREGVAPQSSSASPASQFVASDACLCHGRFGNDPAHLLGRVPDVQSVCRLVQLKRAESHRQFYRGTDRSGNLVQGSAVLAI